MNRHAAVAMALAVVVGAGCGEHQSSRNSPAMPDSPVAKAPQSEPPGGAAGEGMLPHPFSADQIRGEWIVGFELIMRRETPEGEALERWRVVEGDEEGVGIEFVAIDALGNPLGTSQVRRSSWLELRDHASFPEASSKRTSVTRETRLGHLDGWLYTVEDETAGTVSEFFFARDLPGAPVHLLVKRGDEVVMVMEQMERFRPSPSEAG